MRGFYIGLPGKAVRWLETCKELCANAVVLDLKNDDGEITCKGLDLPSDFPYKELIGCRNIKEILSILKKKRIYTIARIVVFKDKYMATLMPNLAVLTKEKNVFVDKEKSVWLNPYNKDVWVYIANIAKGAAKVGFDEVQLDYVRFSAYRDKKADYGPTSGNTSRIAIINQFIDFIKSELAAFDVKLSIDVFGCIIPDVLPLVEESSARLGQDFQSIAERVDFICPMIYPSHFPSGSLRIKHPDLHPYKIIYTSTLRTIEAIKKNPKIKAKVRPWLQAFSAFWLRKGAYQHYGKTQALAQERATIAAGADQLCFWNSGAKYASILED
jgi:hypothetical protein